MAARSLSDILALDTTGDNLQVAEALCEIYPEILWLTKDALASPEGVAATGPPAFFSTRLSPDKKAHVEFDRTIVGILCLLWVLKSERQCFTACQNEKLKLSEQSFADLKRYTETALQDAAAEPLAGVEALLVATVINDLGKVRDVVQMVREITGVDEVDHDKILLMGLKAKPESFPSFQRISAEYQRLILDGLEAKFNFGQFVQGENVPGSLTGMKLLLQNREALDLFILHAIYDMAGAAGQFNAKGSVVLQDALYQDMRLATSCLHKLTEGASFVDVCNDYYNHRGQAYGLSTRDRHQRALIRICCMLRIHTVSEALLVVRVSEGIAASDIDVWNNLCQELNCTGVDGRPAILLYYGPALLVNYKAAVPDAAEAVRRGLLVMEKLFRCARAHIAGRQGDGVFTADIADVAGKVRSAADRLPTASFELEPLGDDGRIRVAAAAQ